MANHSEYGTKTLSVRVATKDYVKVIEAAEAKKLSTSEYVTYRLFREEAEIQSMKEKITSLTAQNSALTKDLVNMRGTLEQTQEQVTKLKGQHAQDQVKYQDLLKKWNDLVKKWEEIVPKYNELTKKQQKKGFFD